MKNGKPLWNEVKRLESKISEEIEYGSVEGVNGGFKLEKAKPGQNGEITLTISNKTKGVNHSHPKDNITLKDASGKVKTDPVTGDPLKRTTVAIPSFQDLVSFLSIVKKVSDLNEIKNENFSRINHFQTEILKFKAEIEEWKEFLKKNNNPDNIPVVEGNIATRTKDIENREEQIAIIKSNINTAALVETYYGTTTSEGTYFFKFSGDKSDADSYTTLINLKKTNLTEFNKTKDEFEKNLGASPEKKFLKALKNLNLNGIELYHFNRTTGDINKKRLDKNKVIDEKC